MLDEAHSQKQQRRNRYLITDQDSIVTPSFPKHTAMVPGRSRSHRLRMVRFSRVRRTKDLAGGALEAAQIPAAFIGAPSEAGAEALTSGTGKLFGDVEKAGDLFNEVAAATRDKAIELSDDV
jgi:hypothetical protein